MSASRFALTAALFTLAAAAAPLRAQGPDTLDLGRAQDIAARPMAMGGSYTAVANDASALYYNPAGLSAVKKHEFSLSVDQATTLGNGRTSGFATEHLDQELTRIQSLGFLLPIPTTRGGLSFAFGFYRPRTFSELIGFNDPLSATRGAYKWESEGTLNQYRVGMGVDLAPDVSVGLALGYVGGEQDIRIQDSSESGYVRTYHGFNVEPALMFKITPRLRLGASLVAWESFPTVDETYEVAGVGNSEGSYSVDMPFQLKLGMAYQGDSYLLSADYKLNDFSEYRYGFGGAEVLENPGYGNEHILSVGAEKFLAPMNTVLRGGYAYNILPERIYSTAYNLHRFSAGVGFLFSGSFALDAAYSFSFWELQDQDHYYENREHRALVSFSYRY